MKLYQKINSVGRVNNMRRGTNKTPKKESWWLKEQPSLYEKITGKKLKTVPSLYERLTKKK